MASADSQSTEQLRLLQERFPQEPRKKLSHLLRKFNGDADLVRHFSRVLISFLSPLIPPMRVNGGSRLLNRRKNESTKSFLLNKHYPMCAL